MPVPVELVIKLNENGSVTVSGPISDKLFAFGLLEVAKETISEFHAQNKNLVQPVTLGLKQ